MDTSSFFMRHPARGDAKHAAKLAVERHRGSERNTNWIASYQEEAGTQSSLLDSSRTCNAQYGLRLADCNSVLEPAN
jgi:hypothetical protein